MRDILGVSGMGKLPKKPDRPYDKLFTYEQQNLHSVWHRQEIIDPYHNDKVPFPPIEEAHKLYYKFLERVYAQSDDGNRNDRKSVHPSNNPA